MHGYVPMDNMRRGWSGEVDKTKRISSQLMNVLKNLQRKGFIFLNKIKGKYSSIKLNFDKEEIQKSDYFYFTKRISSHTVLSKDIGCLAVAMMYARFNFLKTIYTSKISSLLGLDQKTARIHLKKLHDHKIIILKKSYYLTHSFKTYRLVSDYIIKKYAKRAFVSTVKSEMYQNSRILDNIIHNIINNITYSGILLKRMQEKAKSLEDYSKYFSPDYSLDKNTNDTDLMLNGIQMTLHQNGMKMSKEFIYLKVQTILMTKKDSCRANFISNSHFIKYISNCFKSGNQNSLSLNDIRSKPDIISAIQETLLSQHERNMGENFIAWRLKHMKGEFSFRTEALAIEFLANQFKKEFRSDYVTQDWDIDNPERAEKDIEKPLRDEIEINSITMHNQKKMGSFLSKFNIRLVEE